MSCPPYESLFLATHPDHLSSRMHLHRCPNCQALVDADRDFERALFQLSPVIPEGDFVGEVMQRVEALPGQYLFRTFAWIWGGAFLLWCLVMGAPGVAVGFIRGIESMQRGAGQLVLLARGALTHPWPVGSPWVLALTLFLAGTAWLFHQLAFSRFLR